MVAFLTRRSLSREVLNWPMKKCMERREEVKASHRQEIDVKKFAEEVAGH